LASQVAVTVDSNVGTMTLTVSGANGARDASIANAFANSVQAFLVQSALQNRAAAIAAATEQMNALQTQVVAIDAQTAGTGAAAKLASSRQSALLTAYQSAFSNVQDLRSQPAAQSSMQLLEAATPVPVESTGFTPPRNPKIRMAIAILLAIGLSVVGLLLLDRVDTRLRRRESVEDATRLPVLAEIPTMRRRDRRHRDIAIVEAPGGALADAYRTLRASLLLMPSRPVVESEGTAGEPGTVRDPQVILVTSPSPSEGKTTTVVNLAAAMAEAGRSVIVLDCDFRRPMAARHFRVDRGPGLCELITHQTDLTLAELATPTNIAGVRLVQPGQVSEHPAALVARLAPVIADARRHADIVIVDAAPILNTSDAADLVPDIDTVLVVIRYGKTDRTVARRTAERLARLEVATAGVAIVGDPAAESRYVTYGGYRVDARDSRFHQEMIEAELRPRSRRNGHRQQSHEEPSPRTSHHRSAAATRAIDRLRLPASDPAGDVDLRTPEEE
jgi:capsular exopolysaccharide synthesis family protein